MSYYATDEEIAARWFYGETVPGTNTILTAVHTGYKDSAMNFIKALVSVKTSESAPTDNYGLYKELFLELYGQKLRGESFSPPEYLLYLLKARERNVGLRVTNQWDTVYERARTQDEQ